VELTRGTLDAVTVLDERVRIAGWVAALEASRVEGFGAEIGRRPHEIVAVESGLESPDIARHFPHLFEADHCKFLLDVARGRQEDLEDTMVAVTPLLSSGQPGCVMLSPVAPTIAAPSETDVDLVGGGTYAGLEFLSYFVSLAGLRPEHSVMDIGCGVGRMAYPLAYFLDPKARYLGFDIVETVIRWPEDNLTPRFANFVFKRLNVHNQFYNPSGSIPARELVFPTEALSFDFAFLTSVFTHMQGPEVRHYLDEIVRVLRRDGRCLLTCFLIDEESRSLMEAGVANHDFRHPGDACHVERPDLPEAAVGFEGRRLLGWLEERGLAVVSRCNGTWCGRRGLSYQDILVVQKTRS